MPSTRKGRMEKYIQRGGDLSLSQLEEIKKITGNYVVWVKTYGEMEVKSQTFGSYGYQEALNIFKQYLDLIFTIDNDKDYQNMFRDDDFSTAINKLLHFIVSMGDGLHKSAVD